MAKGESMGINPLSDRILVRREEQDEKTPGGIYIPANAREKLNVGTVLAVGRGKVLDTGRVVEPSVKAGDRVVFGKYAGQEFERDGQKGLLFLREDELHGVLEG